MELNSDLIIYQENGLYGTKNKDGIIIIPAQYKEMQPFSCGLSLVRNTDYQYSYINIKNEHIIPFGMYSWCDPQFTCGFSRVLSQKGEQKKWGIIDTIGNIVVPLIYDRIWTLKEEYLFSTKAFIDDKEEKLNLHQLANKIVLDGLNYICTYSIEAFKQLMNCNRLYIKKLLRTNQLIFTYGCNIGYIAGNKIIPEEPVVSIVTNSYGKIFPLLMEKSDIGKYTLPIAKIIPQQAKALKRSSSKISFWDHKAECMNDDWSATNVDEQAYYNGWSRDDVESGLADAFEGESDARWNID